MPKRTVKRKPKIEPEMDTEPEEAIPEPEPEFVEVTLEPDEEVTVQIPAPSKEEQIDALLKEHPPFLPIPTSRYYGETLYPWLHELEQLLE